jgi:hypothetical protein
MRALSVLKIELNIWVDFSIQKICFKVNQIRYSFELQPICFQFRMLLRSKDI